MLLASGSDDPALTILRGLYGAQYRGLAFMATVGSEAGLESIRAGVADFATAHLLDPERRATGACQPGGAEQYRGGASSFTASKSGIGRAARKSQRGRPCAI